jgi:hypothetical protein
MVLLCCTSKPMFYIYANVCGELSGRGAFFLLVLESYWVDPNLLLVLWGTTCSITGTAQSPV